MPLSTGGGGHCSQWWYRHYGSLLGTAVTVCAVTVGGYVCAQIMELQEAAQIHQNLLHSRQNAVHDMKAIVKTWRNRLPVISDDLRHWSDVFTWRQHHYQFIVSHYSEHEQAASQQSMLGVHASAQVRRGGGERRYCRVGRACGHQILQSAGLGW